MAISVSNLYVETDNLIRATVTDNDGVAVTGATVKMFIARETILNPDAAAAEDVGGGEVDIPCAAHGLIAGDDVKIIGTVNYDGEYNVVAGTTTDKIRITSAYVAETFTGNEQIYNIFPDHSGMALAHQGAGVYEGTLEDSLILIVDAYYYVFISVVDGASKALVRKKWQAAFMG